MKYERKTWMEFLSNRLVRFLGSPLEQAEKILKSIEHLSVISSRAVVASGNNVLATKIQPVCLPFGFAQV